MVRFHQQVVVGRRQGDGARLDGILVTGLAHPQGAAVLQRELQLIAGIGAAVLYDRQRQAEVAGQRGQYGLQGPQTPERSADYYDVVFHKLSLLRRMGGA